MIASTLKQIEEAYLEAENEEEIEYFTRYCKTVTIRERLTENE